MIKKILGTVLALGVLASPVMAEDVVKGKKVYFKCMSCHSMTKGKNKSGPTLFEVVGREAASVEGYRYSKGMKKAAAAGLVWNEAELSEFLLSPKTYVKGTKMSSFRGLKKDEDRANVIAYLKTLVEE